MRTMGLLGIAAGLAALVPAEAMATTLIVNSNGQLTGATGVAVNGSLYDVTFVDGTCSAVFDGCDSVFDFAFTQLDAAFSAARALFAQVFVDGPAGSFDTNDELTLGCDTNNAEVCFALIPYGLSPGGSLSSGAVNRGGDLVANGLFQIFFVPEDMNTNDYPTATWAVFTPAAGVPEPSTWAMMLLGFGAAGLAMRRRRHRPQFMQIA